MPIMPTTPEPNRSAQNQGQALALARLGHLQIGVLDYDIHSAQLIRKALSSIGVTQTYLSRNTDEILEIIQQKEIDILIAAKESRPLDGLALVKKLRAADSSNRMLPIILTTSDDSTQAKAEARNAGANEMIVKPFNMRDVLSRISAIVDNPRQFILAPNYTGPCRRETGTLPEGVAERRGAQQPITVGADALKDVYMDDRPRVIAPDYTLRTRLEASVSSRLGGGATAQQERTETAIKQMISEINAMRQAFVVIKDDAAQLQPSLLRICEAALTIRSRAIPTDFPLAARVATALHDFCKKYFKQEAPGHMIIIEKHIDTLQAIISGRLQGEENATARELISFLQQLIRRYI